MRYIVVFFDENGVQTKRYIEATRISVGDYFMVFHNKSKKFMINREFVLFVLTEDFDLVEGANEVETRTTRNEKIIDLYKLRKKNGTK